MGNVAEKYIDVSVTPTITAGAYTQYDVCGGLLTFAMGGSAGGCLLTGLKITDKGKKANAMTLYFFSAVPATAAIANNGAMALAVADGPMLVDTLDIATGDWASYDALGWYVKQFSPPYSLEWGANASVYVYAVLTAASPTAPASTTDLTFTLRTLAQR
jgi:hypothetical protein